jgi:hypothetical protein
MSNTNLFAVFNDVEAAKADKQKKKEKEAKKKAGRQIVSDFDATQVPRTNLEKKLAAQRGASVKHSKQQLAKKRKAKGEPGPPADEQTVASVCAGWDTPGLIDRLDEIESSYLAGSQEHVQVVKLAEYLEEQFLGVVCDWSYMLQLAGDFDLPAGSLESPVSSLPNKSCEAILKWLRRRGRAAKTGLVSFLLNHMWATLEPRSAKGSGVGVRMLLQLVARQDAGCVAANLSKLPLDGMDRIRPAESAKPPSANVGHPLSAGQCVWVLRQVTTNACTSRPQVFDGWWRFMLPLLADPSSSALMLEASNELFSYAEWEKTSPGPMDDVSITLCHLPPAPAPAARQPVSI